VDSSVDFRASGLDGQDSKMLCDGSGQKDYRKERKESFLKICSANFAVPFALFAVTIFSPFKSASRHAAYNLC